MPASPGRAPASRAGGATGAGAPRDPSSVRALLLPVGRTRLLVEGRRADRLEMLELLHVTEDRQVHEQVGCAGELRRWFPWRLAHGRSRLAGDARWCGFGRDLTLRPGLAAPLRCRAGSEVSRAGRH